MFVQSERCVEEHGGRRGDIAIYGQESNHTTWRLAKMNLAIRGLEGDLGPHNADTFHNDLHKDLKADFILANPPFNVSDWGGDRLRDDVRWRYGAPPPGNANFAWVQHMVHHLAPQGVAGFVLANGSMSSQQSGEGEIRKSLVEYENGDCVFFDGQSRGCTVYEDRPRQCRTWPFWESNIRNEAAWKDTCESCPGSGKGKSHMDDYGYDEDDEENEETEESEDE